MQYLLPTSAIFIAFFIAFVFTASIAVIFRITKNRSQEFFWTWLITLLGIIPVLTDLRATRGSTEESLSSVGWTPPGYISFISEWGAKGITYLILTFALAHIALHLRFRSQQKNPGTPIFLAFCGMALPIFISAFAGTKPSFSQFLVFAPLIITLAYLKRPTENWQWYSNKFRYVFIAYLLLSGIAVAVAPSLTTSTALTLIPKFDFRVNGIFSHSNTLAIAALGYLTLDFANRRERRYYDYAATIFALLMLLLTQSKTAIGCTIFSLAILSLARIKSNSKHRNPGVLSLGLVTFIFLALPILFGVALLITQYGSQIGQGLDNQAFKSLSTLTGRTNIWAITLQSWRENIIFGYGPSLWSMEYRLTYAPQYALVVGMAHNQIVQTLGESGLIGLSGLLIYCVVLLNYGFKFFRETNGASLAFAGSFIIRGVSETPFRHIAIDVMFFMHFAFFVLCLSLLESKKNALK
ncbi:O-antigen ligase family protein [Rhodoferax sp. TBRC 17198]|uniref:O-antigen ligase family protein n=1 Tax=Rhodoferax potami TaxID=3068338 RepID=UPI0028BF3C35|nr:O-antigen ligase family protein [Rhodoferax sp. TBRC 17198]MDT7522965.1 O-antigen ligase family protein [Rhodoferax sp. TBRC 17198]